MKIEQLTDLQRSEHFVIDKSAGKFKLTAVGGPVGGKVLIEGVDTLADLRLFCGLLGLSDVRDRSNGQ